MFKIPFVRAFLSGQVSQSIGLASGLLASGLMLTAPAQAVADGYGLNSPSGETAIVGLDTDFKASFYTFYTASQGQKIRGQMYLDRKTASGMEGSFSDRAVTGNEGCRGRISVVSTSSRDARVPTYTLTFFVDGKESGHVCNTVGQTFRLPGMTWGKVRPIALEAARGVRIGYLVAQEEGSPINVRDAAGTASRVRHVGYGGDRVSVRSATMGSDDYLWYNVTFAESGAQGWVRGDFLHPSID
jgi:hypothetical protein